MNCDYWFFITNIVVLSPHFLQLQNKEFSLNLYFYKNYLIREHKFVIFFKQLTLNDITVQGGRRTKRNEKEYPS